MINAMKKFVFFIALFGLRFVVSRLKKHCFKFRSQCSKPMPTIVKHGEKVADALMMTESPQPSPGRSSEDLEQFRSYLYLLARAHIGRRNRARLDPSDIVQQTLLHAHQKQSQFRGASEAELMGWLRQILANNLADAVRGLARAKRDISRERPLDGDVDDSFTRVDGWLAGAQSSPSQQVVRAEELLRMAEALTSLPDLQHEAIVLNHLQGLPLAEVGQQLGKTPAAVAGLLHRGLKQLRELLSQQD
jgi:RNA polymerase sigma-70 factor (ECF subfamily)